MEVAIKIRYHLDLIVNQSQAINLMLKEHGVGVQWSKEAGRELTAHMNTLKHCLGDRNKIEMDEDSERRVMEANHLVHRGTHLLAHLKTLLTSAQSYRETIIELAGRLKKISITTPITGQTHEQTEECNYQRRLLADNNRLLELSLTLVQKWIGH